MNKAIILGFVLYFRFGWALNPSLDVSQYAHTSWKISEAFGTGTTYAMAQTPDGYLWLAMESGLRRFDGVRTVEWQPPLGVHFHAKGIRNLMTARDGTLWIGTGKELVSWKDGKLTQYPEFDGHDVSELLEDREGTIWATGRNWDAGSSQPGKVCSIKSGRVQCFGIDGRFGYAVTALYEDSRGNLWFGTSNGLWRWKPGSPEHYPIPGFDDGVFFPKKAILEDGQGGLLITGPRGIHRFIDGKFSPYPLPSGAPQIKYGKLLRDRDGGLWIGTWDSGLLHVHEGRVDVLTEADGLTNHSIENLFEDREGNIWVAGTNGLDCFRDYAVSTLSTKQGLSSPFVTSVLGAGDGSVWIGTSDGLNRWKDGRMSVYRKSDGLPDSRAGTLYQEPGGRIWISTARGLAYLEDGRFTPWSAVDLQIGSQNSVARDGAGNLWTTIDNGLYRLSGRKVAERFSSPALGFRGSVSTLLAVDRFGGGLWVASWAGGVVYLKDGHVSASYGPKDGLGEGRVNALEVDSGNTLWAPTDGGLSRIKNGRVATLTSKNGLPCDPAHGVMEDDEHSLWIYMACGLVRISRPELDAWVGDPKRQIQVTAFDSYDGVKSHSGVQQFAPRMTKSADGKVWFAPLDGASFVDPRRLPFNRLPPPVRIEQVTADHQLRWQNLSGIAASKLRLPALSRDLEIDYTALSFTVPEKVRFKYKLEGYDRDWQDAGNRRQAFYTNLSPRPYRFRVIASNNSGVWNEAGDSLEFSVAPAYYQTAWFGFLCLAAFGGLIWTLHRYRLHQVAREINLRMEERVNERTRIARELHDTLLQSFHGLLLRFQAVENMLPPGKPKEVLEKAIDQAARAITESRDAVHELRSSTVVKNDLALAIRTLGDELAGRYPAAFEVAVAGGPRDLHPILRDEIYRIAGEALRNAFQHAEAKRVQVELHYGDRELRLRITDDGKGIAPEVLKEGRTGHYGLPGMRERAALLGGTLEVWSELEEGTEIELKAPLGALK